MNYEYLFIEKLYKMYQFYFQIKNKIYTYSAPFLNAFNNVSTF